MAALRQYERFEVEFFDPYFHGDRFGTFTNVEAADYTGYSTREISRFLDNYQNAQRREKTRTRYVLHRLRGTRTASTVWKLGTSTTDAREIVAGLADDQMCRIDRAVTPDLAAVGRHNPRAKIPEMERIAHGAREVAEGIVEALS